MYKTRICLKLVGNGLCRMLEQPNGYTISNEFMDCYNRWANVSHEFYEKWNAEFAELHPELVGTCLIDNQTYKEFIEPLVVAAWNQVNKRKLVLLKWDLDYDDWFYRKPNLFERIRA